MNESERWCFLQFFIILFLGNPTTLEDSNTGRPVQFGEVS